MVAAGIAVGAVSAAPFDKVTQPDMSSRPATITAQRRAPFSRFVTTTQRRTAVRVEDTPPPMDDLCLPLGTTPITRWRPCPDLAEEADIVPARPVLDDHAVDNPPDVDVRPRNGRAGDLGSHERWHGRGLVAAVHRHVVDHELAVSDQVVVIDGDLVTEIVDEPSRGSVSNPPGLADLADRLRHLRRDSPNLRRNSSSTTSFGSRLSTRS